MYRLQRLSTKASLAAQTAAPAAAAAPAWPHAHCVPLPAQSFAQGAVDPHKAPVVMLHGLFGARQNYASVGRQLAAATARDVVAVDMRNHGRAAHAMPHSYECMAHDTAQYLESWGRPVVLAGHSMGAKVGMLVALQRPELVERLVVIDNAPVAQPLSAQFTRDLEGMCAVEREVGADARDLRAAVDRVLARYEPSAAVRVFLAANVVRPSRRAPGPVRMRVPVRQFAQHDVLRGMGSWPAASVAGKRFAGPVAVMRAARSEFVPARNLACFASYFGDCRTVDFDCGHWLVSEQPDRFVREMVSFLESSARA